MAFSFCASTLAAQPLDAAIAICKSHQAPVDTVAALLQNGFRKLRPTDGAVFTSYAHGGYLYAALQIGTEDGHPAQDLEKLREEAVSLRAQADEILESTASSITSEGRFPPVISIDKTVFVTVTDFHIAAIGEDASYCAIGANAHGTAAWQELIEGSNTAWVTEYYNSDWPTTGGILDVKKFNPAPFEAFFALEFLPVINVQVTYQPFPQSS